MGYRSKDTKVHLIDGFDGKVRFPGSVRDDVMPTACNCPPGRLAGGARGWSVLLHVTLDEAEQRLTCSYREAIARQATAPVEATVQPEGGTEPDGDGDEPTDLDDGEGENEPDDEH